MGLQRVAASSASALSSRLLAEPGNSATTFTAVALDLTETHRSPPALFTRPPNFSLAVAM